MSGWFFDEKKSKKDNKDDEENVYESKMDYVWNVAKFLEDGVKEMTKDIKKF